MPAAKRSVGFASSTSGRDHSNFSVMPGAADVEVRPSLPLRFQAAADPREFENFVLPARPLTTAEKRVYRDLARRWAEVHVTDQISIYITFCETPGAVKAQKQFVSAVDEMRQYLGCFQDPRLDAMVEKLTFSLWDQSGHVIKGIRASAAERMNYLMRQDPPQSLGFWENLMTWLSHP